MPGLADVRAAERRSIHSGGLGSLISGRPNSRAPNSVLDQGVEGTAMRAVGAVGAVGGGCGHAVRMSAGSGNSAKLCSS
jgi:hypothetical protein